MHNGGLGELSSSQLSCAPFPVMPACNRAALPSCSGQSSLNLRCFHLCIRKREGCNISVACTGFDPVAVMPASSRPSLRVCCLPWTPSGGNLSVQKGISESQLPAVDVYCFCHHEHNQASCTNAPQFDMKIISAVLLCRSVERA